MPGKSFRFSLGLAVAGVTEAIASIRVEESVNGASGWAALATVAVGDLITEASGKMRLDAPTADQAAYHRLVPISVAGIERQSGVIYPPLPVNPDTFIVYAWTIDAGLGVQSGVSFSCRPKGAHAVAGAKIVVEKGRLVTDAAGYAALMIPADAGIVRVALGPVAAEIDTGNRAGQVINLKDLL